MSRVVTHRLRTITLVCLYFHSLLSSEVNSLPGKEFYIEPVHVLLESCFPKFRTGDRRPGPIFTLLLSWPELKFTGFSLKGPTETFGDCFGEWTAV